MALAKLCALTPAEHQLTSGKMGYDSRQFASEQR
jgi:hypothetical protein